MNDNIHRNISIVALFMLLLLVKKTNNNTHNIELMWNMPSAVCVHIKKKCKKSVLCILKTIVIVQTLSALSYMFIYTLCDMLYICLIAAI